jgi:hypothetical protein
MKSTPYTPAEENAIAKKKNVAMRKRLNAYTKFHVLLLFAQGMHTSFHNDFSHRTEFPEPNCY